VLMSDLSALRRHAAALRPRDGTGFRLVVLDPPWENASVRRGSQYKTVPSRQLLGLPLPQLFHAEVRIDPAKGCSCPTARDVRRLRGRGRGCDLG
jgi:hypothetical protein